MRVNRMKKILMLLLAAAMILVGNVSALADGEVIPETFGGQIQIVDAQTGKKIGVSGAEYQVSDTDGAVVETGKTNANGTIYLNGNFIEGKAYYINALKSPKGYALNTSKRAYTVTKAGTRYVNGRQSYVFEVKEQPIRGRVRQVDTNGKAIKEAGSIFTIYDSNGKLFDTIVTNSEGIADLHKNIPYGSYMLKATKAPTGYYLNRATVNFSVSDSTITTLSNGSMLCTVTVRNEIIQGRLVSADESKNVIAQAKSTYDIYDAEGRLFDTVTTDANGIATFNVKGVPYGKYTAIVTKAPYKFYKDPTAFSFEVRESSVSNVNGTRLFEVKFPHKAILPTVSVKTYGDFLVGTEEIKENGFTVLKPVFDISTLDSGEYQFYAAQDISLNKKLIYEADELVAELSITEENDTVSKMNIGTYIVCETKTPYGYEPAEDVELDVTQGSQAKQHPTQTVEVQHTMRNTKVSFVAKAKITTTNEEKNGTVGPVFSTEKAEGFIFGLYTAEDFELLKTDEDDIEEKPNRKTDEKETEEEEIEYLFADTLIATAVTDKNGKVTFDECIPFGKYYIAVLAVPEQYADMKDTKIPFSNTSDKKKSGAIEVKLDDIEIPYMSASPGADENK